MSTEEQAPGTKFRTMRRRENSSTYQVPVEAPTKCTDEAKWIQQKLQVSTDTVSHFHFEVFSMRCKQDSDIAPCSSTQENGLKAYNSSISVTDPKQRRKSNEVIDMCGMKDLKLWSTKSNSFVDSFDLGNGSGLHSKPLTL